MNSVSTDNLGLRIFHENPVCLPNPLLRFTTAPQSMTADSHGEIRAIQLRYRHARMPQLSRANDVNDTFANSLRHAPHPDAFPMAIDIENLNRQA